MPQFEYQAVDSGGRMHGGTMDALNANDAVQRLSSQGLIVQGLNIAGTGGRAPVQQISMAAPAPPVVQTAPRPQYTAVSARPKSTRLPKHRYTGFFKDYDLWMLLAQMATILKAGINAHEMLVELSKRHSLKPKAKKALEEMSIWVGAGDSLSDAMSVYPEIFPEGVVGATRAGEVGGYLWEALENTSLQIQASWKLRRVYAWTAFAFWTTILALPIVPVMKSGSLALANSLDGGANQDFVGILLGAMRNAVFGAPGIVFLLMTIVWLFGPYVTGRHAFLGMRHRLAASTPILGRRSRMESGRELTFHLERLSASGISPMQSWQLASLAVPNQVFRDQMAHAGKHAREDTPYSELLPRTWIAPAYVDMVRTGEMTGTTPQAFNQIQRLAEGEQKSLEAILKIKAWVWVALFTFGVSAIIMAVIYRDFNQSMIDVILKDT